jgi:polyisoprenoid-binding protein YceI
VLLAGVVLVAAGAATGAYWFFFAGGDEPPPAALSGAEPDGGEGDAPGSISGTWTVVPGDETEPSFAGYRVNETAFGVGRPSEAVGRTQGVDGSITIDGTTIADAELTVDLSTLASDDRRRDNVLRGRALETDRHPTATFRLTEPIDLGAIPATGERRSVDAVGDLTLHGVTRTVTMPLEAALVDGGSRIEVAGAVEIAMADFDIEPPNVAGVVTVADRGTVEVHLFLEAS